MLVATTRWWLRTLAPSLVPHLVPRFLAWAMVAVQLDAMVNMADVSRELLRRPPWASVAAFVAVGGLLLLDERVFVRHLVLGPAMGVLRRQPVPLWAHGPGVALLLAAVLAPAAGVGWLAWRAPFAGPLWVALLLSPMGLAAAGFRVLPTLVLAIGGVVIAIGHDRPWVHLLLGLAAVALSVLWLGRLAVLHASPPTAPPAALPWRPRSALGAIVARDALVVWRLDRARLLGAMAYAPFVGLAVAAARRNGPYVGSHLAAGIIVAMALLGPTCLGVCGELARRLGSSFDPPQWPVTAARRAVALLVMALVPLSPAWAAAVVAGGADLGADDHLRVIAVMLAVSAGAAAFVALRPARPDHGIFPWYLALVLALTWLGGAPLAAGLAVGAAAVTALALERRRMAR
jgi:hypothetical protein